MSTTAPEDKNMDELVALCKRRGFVYPASEIYGGLRGFWDYGPLGTALKNNIRDWWWRCMVDCPPIGPDGEPVSIVGLDSAIIQNPKAWQHSGHVGGFNDPMVDCTETKKRYRADHVMVVTLSVGDPPSHSAQYKPYAFLEGDEKGLESAIKKALKAARKENLTLIEDDREIFPLLDICNGVAPQPWELSQVTGPDATKPGTLTEPRAFNLMLDTYPGPIRDEENKAYLRPETAQGIFLNFKNVLDTMRVKVPFGIAQIGKSFRNEVTPRNFIFRSREFEQMEMEFFCPPDESQKWYEFWRDERYKWWLTLGVSEDNLILRDHGDDELAHYSSACVDVEYKYPFTAPGFGELEGVAHRGDYDLTAHSKDKQNNKDSNTKLDYFAQELQVRQQNEGVDKEEIKQR